MSLREKLKLILREHGLTITTVLTSLGKAAAALPGIVGSIIAGVLNFLKKFVTATAGHVWIFLTSVVALIGYRLMYPPDCKKR